MHPMSESTPSTSTGACTSTCTQGGQFATYRRGGIAEPLDHSRSSS